MPARPTKLVHWALLTGLLLFVTIVVLIWSTRGLGYPNPVEVRSPVRQLSVNSLRDRDIYLTHALLLCLDSLSRNELKKAVGACDIALSLDPKNVTALKLRGNAYLHLGNGQRAVADFTHAIQIWPKDPEAYRFRAGAFAALHRDSLALLDYKTAITLTPDNPLNFQLRGYFYQVRGKYRMAIADFSTAIAIQPSLAVAWNSRCWTRAVADIDLRSALADCNRALRLAPTNANIWDSRGLVFLKLKQYRSAIADYNIALSHDHRLASSLFGRGAAKLQLNDHSAAADIATAKSIDPAIETRFLAYGVKLRTIGPSGT